MRWCLIIDGPGGRRRVPLTTTETVIVGCAHDCQIQIDQPTISRHHAALQVTAQGVQIEDLGSRNGSFIGNRRLPVGVPELIATPGTVRLGEIEILLGQIADADANPHPSANAPSASSASTEAGATFANGGDGRFLRHELVELLRYAATRPGQPLLLLAYAQACARSLPIDRLSVGAADGSVLFDWTRDGCTAPCEALELTCDRQRWLVGATPPPSQERVRHLAELGTALAALAECESVTPTVVAAAKRPFASMDPRMQRIYRRAARVAGSDICVLIRGESGTGKELLARFLHQSSPRNGGPFVAVNCAAFSTEMLEAELFGVEKGAATGVTARAGVFERASGGTLLLDEVGDMAPAMQARILRVLQEREVQRVGGRAPIKIDVRLISATHCDLEQMLRDGRFRHDLIHRIADWEVELPPLRDRPADIIALATGFLFSAARTRGLSLRGLSQAAAQALLAYHWPGNVREIEREMARVAVFLDQDSLVMTDDLSPSIRGAGRAPGGGSLQQQLDCAERQIIARALCQADQQPNLAAQNLGISRSTLYRRLRDFDLLPDAAADGEGEDDQ